MKHTKQRLLYVGMSLRLSVFMLLMPLVFPSITLAAQCSEIFTQGAEDNINPNLGVGALDLTGKLSNPKAWPDSVKPLGSGEYVYNGDALENDDLELTDEAEATVFVNGNLTLGERVRINQNGDPSQLLTIVSGSFSTTENTNSENKKIKVNGFVYAAGGAIDEGNDGITHPIEWIDEKRFECTSVQVDIDGDSNPETVFTLISEGQCGSGAEETSRTVKVKVG